MPTLHARYFLVGIALLVASSPHPVAASSSTGRLLALYDFADGPQGWTSTGPGSLGLAASNNGGTSTLLLHPSGPGFLVRSPDLPSGAVRVAASFRVDQSFSDLTRVLDVRSSSGAVLLALDAEAGSLIVNAASGSTVLPGSLAASWHGVDLDWSSGAFALRLDGAAPSTFTATADDAPAYLASSPVVDTQLDLVRAYEAGPSIDETFSSGALPTDLETRDTAGSPSFATHPGSEGFRSPGWIQIEGGALSADQAYLAVPTAPLGAHWYAQAAFKPNSATLPPFHQAALAGLEASGALVWAITVAPPTLDARPVAQGPSVSGDPLDYAVYLLRAHHAPERIAAPLASSIRWRLAQVEADVAADSLTVRIDKQPSAIVTGLDLANIASIASGDIIAGPIPAGLPMRADSEQLDIDDLVVAPTL